MANKTVKASCHPDRLHVAKGLCRPCYMADSHASNRERNLKKMRSYARAVRTGIRKRRPAPCHPDRPHFALELCEPCYHKTPHAKALRKARTKPKPAGLTVTGRTVMPVSRWVAERHQESLRGLLVPQQTAASFFAKRGAK